MSMKIREDRHGYPKVAIVPYRYLRELERDAQDYHRLLARLDVAVDGTAGKGADSPGSRCCRAAPQSRWAGLWRRLLGHPREEGTGAADGGGKGGPEPLPGNVRRLPVSQRPWKDSV